MTLLGPGYEPRWDIDLARGQQGEMFVRRITEMLANGNGQIEVKYDAWWLKTGRLFIERECLRRGKYEPSGIITTQALIWAFVAGKHEFMVAIATDHLRRAVDYSIQRWPGNGDAKCDRGSHPTRGVYIYPIDIRESRELSRDER